MDIFRTPSIFQIFPPLYGCVFWSQIRHPILTWFWVQKTLPNEGDFFIFRPKGYPLAQKTKKRPSFRCVFWPKIRLNWGYPPGPPKKPPSGPWGTPNLLRPSLRDPRNPTQFQRQPLFENFKNPSKSRTPSGMDCVILKDSLRSVSASLRLTSRFETMFKTLKGTASEIFD